MIRIYSEIITQKMYIVTYLKNDDVIILDKYSYQ